MKRVFILLLSLISLATANAGFSTLGSGAVGVNDFVHVMKEDTANNLLIVGGDFTNAGGVFAPFIASWDGTNWAALGNGLNDAVRDVAFFNGELYACGDFTQSGNDTMNYVAKWNGTSWENVGEGFNKKAYTLCVFNNELHCGGIFTETNGNDCDLLAKWNGTEWVEVGLGVNPSWSGLGYRTGVYTLDVFQGQLMVGGQFRYVTNSAFDISENVAIWNGFTWSDAGDSDLDVLVQDFYVLEEYNTLVTLGLHEATNWGYGNSAEVYDGVNWLYSPFVDPLPIFKVAPDNSLYNYGVQCMEIYEGNYYFGGEFTHTTFSANSNTYSASFTDNFVNYYNPVDEYNYGLDNGLNNSVYCMAIFQNDLYIGGAFTRTNDNDIMNHITRWKSYLNYTVTPSPTSCIGDSDGSAYIVIENGVPPYTYSWNNGSTDSVISNVEAGTYTFTINDSDGRQETGSVFISQPNPLILTMSSTPAASNNNGGSAMVSVAGGNGFNTYLWNNGLNTSVINNLPVDTYSVVVTDAKGCFKENQIYVDTLILPSDTATVNPIDTITPIDSTVSIYQLEEHFSLYPNPTKGEVFISLKEQVAKDFDLEIFNILGEKQLNYNTNILNSNTISLQLENAENGIYYIKLTNKNSKIKSHLKIIVKN